MSEKIVQLNEGIIKSELKELAGEIGRCKEANIPTSM